LWEFRRIRRLPLYVRSYHQTADEAPVPGEDVIDLVSATLYEHDSGRKLAESGA